MLAMAAKGQAHEGDWLIADRQTAGRGRQGRVWQSPPGNFYGSTLVGLRAGDPAAPTLALVAAIAAFEALAIWVSRGLMLKWPNDVMVGEAKLAGILLERAGEAVVVGVGVNLAHHPDALDRQATSIAALGVTPPPPEVFAETVATVFRDVLGQWRSEGLDVVRDEWVARAHMPGTPLSARLPDGSVIHGAFDGLTPDCALRLRLADGSSHVIHAGDVFLI